MKEGKKMKRVYMWQPYYLYDDNAYLPYAIGSLAAYAWHDEIIKKNYELKDLFFLRTPVDEVVEKLDDPFLCAFSTYVWNIEYNLEMAKKIREKFPKCKIVFGGHQISPQGVKESFETNGKLTTYSDYFIYDEGEVAFRNLLLAMLEDENFETVDNISFTKNGEHIFTRRSVVKETDFPSPYTEGIFDKIVNSMPEYKFSAVIETNRGCPYHCAYCDWGYHAEKLRGGGGMRVFPIDRVKSEINWCVEHEIEYVYCADSNYGLFNRDEEIVDYAIQQNKKFGYPHKWRATFAKNTTEKVFRINQKINDQGMSKGATLSFQSLNPNTLNIIGRKNIKLDFFTKLLNQYVESHIPTYTEIIMGLPGETYETFCEGISTLLKCGQHKSMNIYACELLPNSPMGQIDFIDKYKIKTIRTPIQRNYTAPNNTDIQEYDRFIVENSSLPFEKWKQCYLFAYVIQCFHSIGLTRYISMYLYYSKNLEYDIFYREMIKYLTNNPETVGGKAILRVQKIVDKAVSDDSVGFQYLDEKFGNVYWPLEEGSYLEILSDLEKFYNELKDFLIEYENNSEILTDLIKYQYEITKKPFDKSHTVKFSYDLPKYFKHVSDTENIKLEKNSVSVKVEVKNEFDDWKDFAKKVIWYGRKNDAQHYEKEFITD